MYSKSLQLGPILCDTMDYSLPGSSVHGILQAKIRSGLPWGFPGSSNCKKSACNAGDLGSIPRLGRSPGEGNGNLLQYSCLGNPMDRGASCAIVYGVAKIRHSLVTKSVESDGNSG